MKALAMEGEEVEEGEGEGEGEDIGEEEDVSKCNEYV